MAKTMASPKQNFGARMAALRAKKRGASAPPTKGAAPAPGTPPAKGGKQSFGQRMAALRAAKKGK